MIYTTNTVEYYHRKMRKVTKNKGAFTNDKALEKLVYVNYRNICKNKQYLLPIGVKNSKTGYITPLEIDLFD